MAKEDKTDGLSFWEHLDVLRTAIVKIVAVAVVFGIAAFCFKEKLFAVILAPKNDGFITYRLFNRIAAWAGGETGSFAVQLINTGLAGQFVIHMKTALCAGVLCASPYILYQLFRFVSPALYACERKYAVRIVGGGYAMFLMGVAVSYFLIFPLTFRFLGTYQVSGEVENMIVLQSYISDVPDNGYRVRDSDFIMAVCQIGVSHRRFHATLPEARYSDYPYRCGCHHADFGRVHVVIGHIADVGFI